MTSAAHLRKINALLVARSSDEKAAAMRRYFPDGLNCIGAKSPDIKEVIATFQSEYNLDAEETLKLTEHILERADYQEEKLVALGLLNRFVKKNYDDALLDRFEHWLENHLDNWALVDDLCMKTVYGFFMTRPHLIEKTAKWARSDISWCRRGSNVAWVKFIERKIGKATYRLDKRLVFENCNLLLHDEKIFVQKSVGWLLKVACRLHERDVVRYIEKHAHEMDRGTLRYAIEKIDLTTRKRLLAI